MRSINFIVIHCSDSDVFEHDDISVIRKWHVDERGWKDVGYHYFIKKDGTIQLGRQDEVAGSHAEGYNQTSIGVCFSGKKKFTPLQFYSASRLIRGLIDMYELNTFDVIAHCQVNKSKTCPNFDIKDLLALL